MLAISASPRHGGNSDVLSDRFLQGAADAGHSVKKIALSSMNISPYTACYGCRHTHECVKRDDMKMILQEFINADAVVLATPVYFYSVSAQLKTMIDRCLPRYQEIRDKDFYYIITAADPQRSAADETIAALRGYLRCLPGATEKGIVFGTGTWDKGDVYQHPSYNRAYDLGKALIDIQKH